MLTPWGDLPVSDAHVHFFSHGFFAALAAQKKTDVPAICAALSWQAPPEDPGQLAAQWVAELDRHRVDRASLSASIPGDKASVAGAVARFPERFHGYFMLNPLAADAPARVRDALRIGLRGICLFPAMHRFSVQDAAVRSVLEIAASRPGAIVFVHCGVFGRLKPFQDQIV